MTNHPEDRHVLAAVIAARAEVLVTWNLQHFPSGACEPYAIVLETPDDFLRELGEAHPNVMADVIRQQASDLTNPAMEVEELLLVLDPPGPQLRGTDSGPPIARERLTFRAAANFRTLNVGRRDCLRDKEPARRQVVAGLIKQAGARGLWSRYTLNLPKSTP
jgi:hypothetical protein